MGSLNAKMQDMPGEIWLTDKGWLKAEGDTFLGQIATYNKAWYYYVEPKSQEK